jgi:hypothetical protein
MASFQAPPGHVSQDEVLVLCNLTQFQLTLSAPDPDLKAGAAAAAAPMQPTGC